MSLPMVVVLAVATFTVHLPNGFSSIKLLSVDAAGAHFGPPGYELPTGPGWAVARIDRRNRRALART
ncbi:MAG TPA: hypothetical protein VFB63_33600, partial [Bryobacteraceae bacterium]|nr:hypothetical protein [Bryobacteraceae bacterium]